MRFFLENKTPLEIDDSRLEEILGYFLLFLKGELPRPLEVAGAVKISEAEKKVLTVDRVKEVIKNSVFGDLLFEKYEVEFSKLSFVIESKIVLTSSEAENCRGISKEPPRPGVPDKCPFYLTNSSEVVLQIEIANL